MPFDFYAFLFNYNIIFTHVLKDIVTLDGKSKLLDLKLRGS